MSTDFLVMGALDGSLRALNALDGSVRWTRSCGHPFGGPALVRVGDSVVAAALDGYVCTLALDDGALRWEMALHGVEQSADPMMGKRAVTNGEVVVVEHGPKYSGLAPADGHVVWSSGISQGVRGWWLLGIGAAHAYILQEELPAPSTVPRWSNVRPRHFVTTALSTWDGTPQWFLRDESPRGPAWDGAAPLVEVGGVVYSYGRGLHAVEVAVPHTLRWTWEYLPENPMGGMLAVGREAVIVTGDAYLGAFRPDTGVPLWAEKGVRRDDGYFEVYSGLVLLGEIAYVGHGESTPGFCIEARVEATGELRWTWPGDRTILRFDDAWRFCGAGDTLYIPSANHMWGIRASDGNQLWHRELPTNFGAFLAIAGADV